MPAWRPDEDASLAARLANRDSAAFETVMRRYNSRLFRIARAILKDDAAAEDALQEAYLDAFRHIDGFHGEAALGTWLTRITINQALMRLRRQKRDRVVVPFGDRARDARGGSEGAPGARAGGERAGGELANLPDRRVEPPPQTAWRAEIRALLEQRLDELPVAFRTVFIMREVEDMTVEETAECLAVPPATVRTRLHRARALLREALARDIDSAAVEVFGFAGERCDRIVATVLARTDTIPRERGQTRLPNAHDVPKKGDDA
jgi:RNA polymerase sigma factor (sigma-70 family)